MTRALKSRNSHRCVAACSNRACATSHSLLIFPGDLFRLSAALRASFLYIVEFPLRRIASSAECFRAN